EYRTSTETLDDGAFGCTEDKQRLVIVDVARHHSDKAVRDTLLHEMCHVAAGPRKLGHGSGFFKQLERLLRQKAPVSIGFPEAGGRTLTTVGQIPKQFRLCRRAMKAAIDTHQAWIENEIKSRKLEESTWEETKANILRSFEAAAFVQGSTWKGGLWAIGRDYELLDIDENPLSAYQELIMAARKAYRRARRDFHEEKRFRAAFEERRAAFKERMKASMKPVVAE